MYRVGLLFDKSAHLFVDLPATKVIFSGIQVDLSLTLHISSSDYSNSQCVMSESIHRKNIQGLDRGDHYQEESLYNFHHLHVIDFRK